jgi:predicted TIM-barrel fold metal-dependent hydrolase
VSLASSLGLADWPHPPCDTHSHVYPDSDDGRHNDASLQDYLGVTRPLGVGRHVVVHSKAHRHDAQCTLDTVARIGLDRARAVVWEDPHWSDADLARLHRAGVRGVRTLFPDGAPVDIAALRNTAAKLAPLGWHILVQADGPAWPACADALNDLPCAVVVDHMGRFGPDTGPGSPAFKAIVRFLRRGGWIKLAAPYYANRDGAADFRPLAPRLHALLEAGGTRAIWGLNWPHVNLPADRRPDEAATLESLLAVIGTGPQARAVLADNAARLYDFAAPMAPIEDGIRFKNDGG